MDKKIIKKGIINKIIEIVINKKIGKMYIKVEYNVFIFKLR